MSVGNPEIDASVGKSAAIYALGTALSRILGLVRDIMIARYFSVDVRDAFVNAFRLPNVFRRILGEGALSASFIPIFIEVRSGPHRAAAELRARRLAAGVFSLLLAVVLTISFLAIVFMEDLLRGLLAGDAYMSVPGKFELTVQLARILFSFLICISLFAYFAAVLNSLKRFALSALAPCLFNLTIITGAYFFSRNNGNPFVLAWSVLVGGFLQMALVAIGAWRAGFFPGLTENWGQPDVLRFLKRVGPSVLGLSVLQLNTIVNMRFASNLAPGSHSYLYLADRIFELPLSLFVVSIGAALLPTLSKNWVDGNRAAWVKPSIIIYGLLYLFRFRRQLECLSLRSQFRKSCF